MRIMPLQMGRRSHWLLHWFMEKFAEPHRKIFDKIFNRRGEEEVVGTSQSQEGAPAGCKAAEPSIPRQSEETKEPTSDAPLPLADDLDNDPLELPPPVAPTALPTIASNDGGFGSDDNSPYRPRLSIIEEVDEPAEEVRKSWRKRLSGGRLARR
jgi:hypothetical protein